MITNLIPYSIFVIMSIRKLPGAVIENKREEITSIFPKIFTELEQIVKIRMLVKNVISLRSQEAGP